MAQQLVLAAQQGGTGVLRLLFCMPVLRFQMGSLLARVPKRGLCSCSGFLPSLKLVGLGCQGVGTYMRRCQLLLGFSCLPPSCVVRSACLGYRLGSCSVALTLPGCLLGCPCGLGGGLLGLVASFPQCPLELLELLCQTEALCLPLFFLLVREVQLSAPAVFDVADGVHVILLLGG